MRACDVFSLMTMLLFVNTHEDILAMEQRRVIKRCVNVRLSELFSNCSKTLFQECSRIVFAHDNLKDVH